MTNGEHQLDIKVVDRGASMVESHNLEILNDENPPTIEVITPEEGDTVESVTILEVEAIDDNQLSEVEYRQVMSHHSIGHGDTMTRLDRSSLAKSALPMYRLAR